MIYLHNFTNQNEKLHTIINKEEIKEEGFLKNSVVSLSIVIKLKTILGCFQDFTTQMSGNVKFREIK
jgi:hypothetical protein